jgi:hypothetical protein
VDERALAELRRLCEDDEALAREAAELRSRDAVIAEARRRAEAIQGFLDGYPKASAEVEATVEQAEAEVLRRRDAVAAAERALEGEAADGETFRRLERIAARERERLSAAVSRRDRALAEQERLEGDAAELRLELAKLADEVRALGGEPVGGLAGVVEWASQAQAELFVTAGQLDRRRDQVIREANELASMLLGEPTFGSTVAQALARVEQR